MPQERPPYPAEFRAEAVRLAGERGHSMREVACDLGIANESLRRCVMQVDAGTGEGFTIDERGRTDPLAP
jgi:transposase